MPRPDVKTLVIGMLLGACAVLAIGQVPAANQAQEPFQITAVSQNRNQDREYTSVYVLEHRTGQVIEYRQGGGGQWQRTPAFQISR